MRRRALPLLLASLATLPALAPVTALAQAPQPVHLNFVNAQLSDVVRSMAVILGVNVVLTGVPDRRISFSTPRPVPVDQVGGVLESILESNGLVLVESGAVAQVMPADRAPATGPVRSGQDLPDPPPLGLITQIVALQGIRAQEGLEVLKPFASAIARIEVMPRANALLITDRGVHVARYLQLLRELDSKATGEAGLRTYVVPLKHASAADLAATLGQLFGIAAGAAEPAPRALEERGLSSALDAFRRRDLEALAQRRATPIPALGQSSPAVTPTDSGAAPASGLVGQTTIVASGATNALVIRTAPPNYPLLQETIEALDIRPPQVLLEVLIAEIGLNQSTQFGINWSVISGDVNAQLGTQQFGDSALASVQDFAVRAVSLNSVDVRAILRALATRSDVRVLSTPHILALNNEEARVLVGSEVPFSQSTRTGLDVVVDRIVQFRNVGTQLTVIPTINLDGYVTFRILQEVSALTNVTIEAALNAPVITTREAETSALVKDGQTVVIGGLISESHDVVESGVPVLKDIPLLGLLFKSRTTRRARTELAIFVTPHVIYTDDDAQMILERERGRMSAPTAPEELQLKDAMPK